jgi:hypothetical protein
MTKQHKATPDEWAQQEDWANRSAFSDSSCIIELRARIEALEAAQQARVFAVEDVAPIVVPSSPAGSLVERVQQSIDDHPFGEEAHAAILEVAAWLKEEGYSTLQAEALAQEANQ